LETTSALGRYLETTSALGSYQSLYFQNWHLGQYIYRNPTLYFHLG